VVGQSARATLFRFTSVSNPIGWPRLSTTKNRLPGAEDVLIRQLLQGQLSGDQRIVAPHGLRHRVPFQNGVQVLLGQLCVGSTLQEPADKCDPQPVENITGKSCQTPQAMNRKAIPRPTVAAMRVAAGNYV